MKSLLTKSLAAAFVIASAGWASANTIENQYVCKPLDETLTPYYVSCRTEWFGAPVENSCACETGYVLVDLDVAPAAIVPRNASHN
jgi:hypothetical protein